MWQEAGLSLRSQIGGHSDPAIGQRLYTIAVDPINDTDWINCN